jgi:hypothetical protein
MIKNHYFAMDTDLFVKEILYRDEVESVGSSNDFVHYASEEIEKIEGDLDLIEQGLVYVRNKQRKKRRLLAKKDKMKVRIELAIRHANSDYMSPSERRTLYYYSRKVESDGDFLERKLCTELGLTWESWELYFSNYE